MFAIILRTNITFQLSIADLIYHMCLAALLPMRVKKYSGYMEVAELKNERNSANNRNNFLFLLLWAQGHVSALRLHQSLSVYFDTSFYILLMFSLTSCKIKTRLLFLSGSVRHHHLWILWPCNIPGLRLAGKLFSCERWSNVSLLEVFIKVISRFYRVW